VREEGLRGLEPDRLLAALAALASSTSPATTTSAAAPLAAAGPLSATGGSSGGNGGVKGGSGSGAAPLSLCGSLLDILARFHPVLAGPADLEEKLALAPRTYVAALELSLALWRAGRDGTGATAGGEEAEGQAPVVFDKLCGA
jgi:hypothetical protein